MFPSVFHWMIVIFYLFCEIAFIAFTLLVGSQEEQLSWKSRFSLGD